VSIERNFVVVDTNSRTLTVSKVEMIMETSVLALEQGKKMKTVLIVDDEYVTHRIVEIILGKQNYQILSAYDGLEAVQILAENQVDLIITDVNMPYIDGISLIELIRTGERYRDLPIVVISASPLHEIPDQAFDKGATAFMYQPFSSYELINLVSIHLKPEFIDGQVDNNGEETI
jgi:CheY-like chemotaxis protein